ncbi:MAG TPA: hypothetical protein VL283_05055 [Candidatus Baltobacteraceae bacterium]|jgi:hypothetical protein|nr:hypothetical protein [Candidatus Baltobacteraceae bacterium]
MSLEHLRALMRTYVPGRRVLIKDEAAAARRDKVPQGVTEGLILKVIPLPIMSVPLPSENLQPFRFGVEVEIETAPGSYDTLIVETSDVELRPLSLDELRRDLWHRQVNFPRSRGIGIDFPPGSGDYGIIDDADFRTGDDGMEDLHVSLRVAVDPSVNPNGINTFYVEADFIQCVLIQRKPSV